MSYFAYTCTTLQGAISVSTLVIFSGKSGLTSNAIVTAITQETNQSLSPELVLIIAPQSISEVKEELCNDSGNFSSISDAAGIGLYLYDENGNVELTDTIRGDVPKNLPLDSLRRQGMTILFRRRCGLVEAGPTSHFVKPSGRLDKQFLLGAHALSDSAEIFFIAFWLLSYIATKDIEHVHVDTSGIASIGLAASIMQPGFNPTIRTFQSYDGVEDFSFNVDRNEVILISASQSGKLAAKISTYVKNHDLIITLFSLAKEHAAIGNVLCDLNYDEKYNVHGFHVSSDKIDSTASSAIRLIGERFIAETQKPRAIVPIYKDAPAVVEEYLQYFAGKDVFRAFKTALSGENRAIWIDVNELIKTEKFKNWIEELVARRIPVATKGIVTFDKDPGSSPLATAILNEAVKQEASLGLAKQLTLTEIQKDKAKASWPVSNSAVLIAGGVTGHGAELLAASQALRDYAEDSYRLYIAAAAVPSSMRSLRLLSSNLKYPHHHFETMFDLIVDRAALVSSWESEAELLSEEVDLPDALVSRCLELNKTSEGLQDNLFLPNHTGKLQIRKNFAFWSEEKADVATQVDVFVTMAVILENLRTSDLISKSRRLTNSTYDRSVISAETFARYNDGVIQAAILRAAYPVELNYKALQSDSRLMGDLIIEMGKLADRPQGEALSEFLLALILKRLILCEEDLLRVMKTIHVVTLSDTQKWLLKRLKIEFDFNG